jgi:hypothetical protein
MGHMTQVDGIRAVHNRCQMRYNGQMGGTFNKEQ